MATICGKINQNIKKDCENPLTMLLAFAQTFLLVRACRKLFFSFGKIASSG